MRSECLINPWEDTLSAVATEAFRTTAALIFFFLWQSAEYYSECMKVKKLFKV